MGKKILALDPRMSVQAHIEDVAEYSKLRTMRFYGGPGTMDRALETASGSLGLSKNLFWSLRYKKPDDLLLSSFLKLKLAQLIDNEAERQRRLLQDDIERAKALGITGHSLSQAEAWAAGVDQETGE